jgi:energy-coupling factor transport system substrate-specific component
MAAPTARAAASPVPTTLVVTLVPAAAALDIVGGYVNGLLGLPTFMDMIGTCVAAIVLGPWWGALTGVIANVGGAAIYGPSNIPFAVVNVAGALVWGYGVRSLGMGRNGVTYFVLNVLVGLVVAVTAAPIVLYVFGGSTGHPSDLITAAFVGAGEAIVAAVFASNILVSIADKVIAGFVALAIIAALPPRYRDGLVLPGEVGGRTLLVATVGTVAGVAILLVYLLVLAPAP